MPKYIFPTSLHTVSDNFQDHKNRGSVNPGTDFQTVIGGQWHQPVWAVADGVIKVVSNGIAGSGGRYLQYLDEYGVTFQDLHLSQILVTEGQSVRQGQQIAISGASAYGSETGTGGPHLHHSMIVRGVNVDFELYVDKSSTTSGNNASPAEQDWFDMATKQDLKDAISEYFTSDDGKRAIQVAVFENDQSKDGSTVLSNSVWAALEHQRGKDAIAQGVYQNDTSNDGYNVLAAAGAGQPNPTKP